MKNKLFTTATAGLAALVLSACNPTPPQKSEPFNGRYVKISTGSNEWILYNLDNNPKTFEVVFENVYGENKSHTVFYAGNYRNAALNVTDEEHIIGMTAQDQTRFNDLGNTIIKYKEVADTAAYNEAKFKYEKMIQDEAKKK